jgi:hypothetical protein
MIFGFFIFFIAVIISAVAEYYSIMGLTAIFAAAYWPVVIMGVALGVGKITATIWLKLNWERASWTYKLYLVPAIVFLMFLTSMGIFGFLSRAHSDLGLETSNIAAQIAVYDDKIKIANDNIIASRKALQQLDDAVDQILGRSSTEQGAMRSVKIRKSQQKERKQLTDDISAEQEIINQLSTERSKIAVQIRKVEAEVGPIKYIAAMIYGNNPSIELLESAVRWVIILIVLVFDPLALCLMLAAQQSIRWGREERRQQKLLDAKLAAEQADQARQQKLLDAKLAAQLAAAQVKQEENINIVEQVIDPLIKKEHTVVEEITRMDEPYYEKDDGPLTEAQLIELKELAAEDQKINDFFKRGKEIAKLVDSGEYSSLLTNATAIVDNAQPQMLPIDEPEVLVDPIGNTSLDKHVPTVSVDATALDTSTVSNLEASTVEVNAFVPKKSIAPKFTVQQPPEAIAPKAKEIIQVPETLDRSIAQTAEFNIIADNSEVPAGNRVKAHFGITFPLTPEKGELFLRVDYLPARLFKFNSSKWIEVDKSLTDTYVYNTEYIKFMIKEIDAGRLDPADISPSEREQIADFLANDEQTSNTP